MPWEPGRSTDAKAWEKRGHIVSYRGATWECWSHDACDAVTDGRLNAAET